ncbi:MAG TPA: hypothetical protein PKE26_04795 [Kiritimatiellia bacterium]|nr:hypothetical protein [Kiritimatiellia bacterium]HMO98408.1 hypothetical protein [Kiritimatiellia bacterium]HMP96461.1 hypothetical protein [Kiritimatiellia bacterium]
MPPNEPFLVFTRPLDAGKIPYMIAGSVACMIYGEPRLTNDVDLVLMLDSGMASRIESLFPAETFYCPPFEVIGIESRRQRRGHFNIIHHDSGLKADIYLAGSEPLQAWGLKHRRQIALGGDTLWIAPPEYVILKKLEYYREGQSEKHIHDIRGMLAVSGDKLDRDFLAEQIAWHRLGPEWALIAGDARK